MTIEAAQSVLSDDVRSFLGRVPRHATIATINPDGTPHQIVIWFTLRDDSIVVNSRHGRRWPSNLRRDGRANLCVYEGEDAVTLEVVAELSYEGEQAQSDIAELARRHYTPEYAEHEIYRYRSERRVSFVLRPVKVHVHGQPR